MYFCPNKKGKALINPRGLSYVLNVYEGSLFYPSKYNEVERS